jgi:hypothetical protein
LANLERAAAHHAIVRSGATWLWFCSDGVRRCVAVARELELSGRFYE